MVPQLILFLSILFYSGSLFGMSNENIKYPFKTATVSIQNQLALELVRPNHTGVADYNSAIFKPLFDGEDMRAYSKLDTHSINSILDNCPSLLRFQIELMKNHKIYKVLNRIMYFSINKLLLYGPPGSGKSALAKAIADYCNFPRQFIIASSLANPYENSSQINLNHIFEPLFRTNEFVVIILDELTSLVNKYNSDRRAIEQLSEILDRCANHKNILFIATTRSIKKLPRQIRNRFCGGMFRIDRPDSPRRGSIINALTKDDGFEQEDINVASDNNIELPNDNLKFIHKLDSSEKRYIYKQTLNFSIGQLYAMKSLAYVFALQRKYEKGFADGRPMIEISLQDYKNSIEHIRLTKKENFKTILGRYYTIFKELSFYMLIYKPLSTIAWLKNSVRFF